MQILVKQYKNQWIGYILIDRPIHAEIGTFDDVFNRLWTVARKLNTISY